MIYDEVIDMSNRALAILFAVFATFGVTTCSGRAAIPQTAAAQGFTLALTIRPGESPASRARPCLIGPSCYEVDAHMFEPCLAATGRCPGDARVMLVASLGEDDK